MGNKVVPFLGNKNPDVFVKMEYRHRDPKGDVRLINFRNPPIPKRGFPYYVEGGTRTLETPKKNDVSGSVSFGTIHDDNHECMNYMHFVNAVDQYTSTSTGTGKSLPFSELKVSVNVPKLAFGAIGAALDKVPDGGFNRVPFAPYQQIMVPDNYTMTEAKAKHEFAHTVRHTLDGSLKHWIKDALRFWYPRTHECDLQTNPGFAFNEGWCVSLLLHFCLPA